MNANDNLERGIADVYEREAPTRAPDWVLASVLDAIDTTPQRRVLVHVPWRFPEMNSFAKLAIAAVVVVAIGAVGLSMLGPRSSSGVGGQPSASPSASPTPTFGATVSPAPPPPLTGTFTSDRHGFSIAYPEGWATQAATAPATSEFPGFGSPEGDYMYDPDLQDHLFIVVVSMPLAGREGADWGDETLNRMATFGDCDLPLDPVSLDGNPGLLCATTSTAVAWAGDRGYVVVLYGSGDDPSAVARYDRAYFTDILASVRLQPEDAVDTPASPSASPSS
jgi:hypothetical protein